MKPSILIGTALGGYGYPAYSAHSQFGLISNMMKAEVVCDVVIECNNFLEEARNKICVAAMEKGATHVLFLDSDIVVSPQAVKALLDMDTPIASGLYFMRFPPHKPVAYRDKKPITDFPENEVIEVDYAGMGCCLIQVDLLNKMYTKMKKPRFFAFEDGLGEDVWFCNHAKELCGAVTKVHTGAKVGHVGWCIFTDEHFRRTEDCQWLKDPNHSYLRVMKGANLNA